MNDLLEKVKKVFAAFLSVFAMLFSFGSEKIVTDIQVETAPEQTICVEWKNMTGTVIYSSEYFTVEKQTDGEWETVAFADDFACKDIATVVYPLQGGTFKFKSEEAFGTKLSDGTYRFSFEYSTADGANTAREEFVISTDTGIE